MSLEQHRPALLDAYFTLVKLAAERENRSLDRILIEDFNTIDPSLRESFGQYFSPLNENHQLDGPAIYRFKNPHYGEMIYDPQRRIATSPLRRGIQGIYLTQCEGLFFGEMMSHPFRVTTYRRLEELHITLGWGTCSVSAIKHQVSTLRGKLGEDRAYGPRNFKLIHTINSVGYSLLPASELNLVQ